MHLPAPGSEAQLAAVCNELQMRVLDRSRPLWDMTFVTGVADGRVTMVHRVHHAAVDGVSSVHVFEQLMGDDEPAPMAGSQLHEPPQSALGLVGEAVGVGVHAAQAAAASLTHPKRLVATAAGLVDLLGQGLPRPHSSLNAGTVGRRRLLVPVRFELAAVKAAGHRHGVTVNDIVLACVTRGLRDLLLARGEPLGEPLHALVPVSVRTAGHLDRAGNEVSAVIVHLPVDERTAGRRLAAIAAQTRRLRSAPDAPALGSLLHWLDALPAALGTATAPLLHHQPLVNLVITNVPGSHRPLALLGTEIVDLVPVVPLAGNLTVGVAVLSYRGHLVVGLHADADHAGDVARLADGIRAELATLRRARPTGPR
jgi:WS/DGAT/MGAT family acyltransferase